jgi:hypothetical protein
MISQRQQRLVGILPGLVLALAQFALLYLSSTYFQFDILTLIGLWLLLSFVAAIPPSFYISQQTGAREEGCIAGGMTGCTAALLTTLGAGVYTLVITASLSPSHLFVFPGGGGLVIAFFLILIFLNFFAVLVALSGAFVGCKLGKRW